MISSAQQWPIKQGPEVVWTIPSNQPAYKPLPLTQVEAVEGSALSLLQQATQVPALEESKEAAPQGVGVPPESSLRSFDTLASFYSVSTPIAVADFLSEHKQLLKLLFSAFPRIKSIWGAQAKLELEVVDDLEGGLPIMTVRVTSTLPDAYRALDRFDEEWWLDHIAEAEGFLNFTLRPR